MSNPLSVLKWTVPTFIVGAVLLGLVPLVWFAASHGGLQDLRFDTITLSVLVFTLKQAFLSTLISVVIGLLAARALARRRFYGKNLLLSLFAVPFALPAIVAVLGVTGVYGNQGWLGGIFNIYGLTGIVLVHVFFNVPLATRMFHETMTGIAPENFRLAAQLSFSDRELFRHVEWPVLKNTLPAIFSLIFLLCAASFVVVLTLGGPSATTLEVAIYHALRIDFDVGRALALSLLQIILCLVLVMGAGQLVLQSPNQIPTQLTVQRFDGGAVLVRALDGAAIFVATAIVVPPIAAIFFAGVPHLKIDGTLIAAVGFSLMIGIGASLLALCLAWCLAQMKLALSQSLALAALIVPPAVLATGWFIALKSFDLGLPTIVLTVITLNGLMALPFAVAVLRARFDLMGSSFDRLCSQLGIAGWNRFWRIDIPFMLPALRQAGLLTFVMSLGDLTAVTLLGSQGLVTLPALIHQQMGNYRSSTAAGTALLLAVTCYGLAAMAERFGRAR